MWIVELLYTTHCAGSIHRNCVDSIVSKKFRKLRKNFPRPFLFSLSVDSSVIWGTWISDIPFHWIPIIYVEAMGFSIKTTTSLTNRVIPSDELKLRVSFYCEERCVICGNESLKFRPYVITVDNAFNTEAVNQFQYKVDRTSPHLRPGDFILLYFSSVNFTVLSKVNSDVVIIDKKQIL